MKKFTKKQVRLCLPFGVAVCFLIAGFRGQDMLEILVGLIWIATGCLQMRRELPSRYE